MVTTEKGFTLIEVLVALGVFSVALLGLEKMHLTAIQVNTVANRLTQATTLAQDRVERFMAMPYNDPLLADTTTKGITTRYSNAGHPDPSPPPPRICHYMGGGHRCPFGRNKDHQYFCDVEQSEGEQDLFPVYAEIKPVIA